jgi:exonuclease VII small subunit
MVNLIGERGGGKSLFAVYRACLVRNEFPDVPVVANFKLNIKGCYYVPDILGFLRTKIALGDLNPVEMLVDEAAISGLESRDSHGLESIFNTRPLALSRKSHSNLWLISQMMSMLDKRAQWLSDFDVLCHSVYETDVSYKLHIPDYFEYTFYNQNREVTNELVIWGKDAYEKLFPLYNTDEVPAEDEIAAQFIQFGRMTEEDVKRFYKIVPAPKKEQESAMARFKRIVDSMRPKETPLDEFLAIFGDKITYEFKDGVEIVSTVQGKYMGSRFKLLSAVLKEDYGFGQAQKMPNGLWQWTREGNSRENWNEEVLTI